jgi:hypothetical protein
MTEVALKKKLPIYCTIKAIITKSDLTAVSKIEMNRIP